jgi:hypothetical protein
VIENEPGVARGEESERKKTEMEEKVGEGRERRKGGKEKKPPPVGQRSDDGQGCDTQRSTRLKVANDDSVGRSFLFCSIQSWRSLVTDGMAHVAGSSSYIAC